MFSLFLINKRVQLPYLGIGVRAIYCQGAGGGNPFAKTILARCPNIYKKVERKLGPCNKIGRTGIWKWLDTVFQGQYLPSLSINYVATNKHLEKIATTVVLDKEGNLSWSGLQWHRSCHTNEMTPLPIILAAIFLTNQSQRGTQRQFPPKNIENTF